MGELRSSDRAHSSVVAYPYGQSHGDPVGDLTAGVATVDQVAIDVLRGAVAHAALHARVGLAGAHQGEHLGDGAPPWCELPGDAHAGGGEQPGRVAAAVILGADIEIDAELFAELER